MEELKDNFDTASVVGYFMEGKLETWLNDRYYEEEAEQVAALSKDDPALARKLCAVFGIACAAEDGVDPEEIAYRQERLNRLKQYTDDETLWAQADKVAFDQEDLADLYDAGVEPIYLCAGSFKIPKSKQNLRYIAIAGAVAEGVQLTQPEKQEEPSPAVNAQPKFEVKRSGDRLLKIENGKKTELVKHDKLGPFAYNEQYAFAVLGGNDCCIRRIDLHSGEKKNLDVRGSGIEQLFVIGSSLLWFDRYGGISTCDFDGDFKEMLVGIDRIRNPYDSLEKVECCDGMLFYLRNMKEGDGKLERVDPETREIVPLGKAESFCIAGRKLYVYSREKSEIYECNLDGEQLKTVKKEVPFITNMHYRNGMIYAENLLDGILFRKRGGSSFQIKV